MKIKKAMLLAAGLGTRLRPLTFETPKPLLPLNGKTLIDYTLGYLAKWGIEEVMVNLHHLGHKIREYVDDGSKYGMIAHYSEELQILGTGGGIKNVQGFFGNDPFVALNGDALLDVDLKALISHHFESNAQATMALKPLAPGDTYQGVAFDKEGWVKGFNSGGKHFYVGLQVLTKDFLNAMPPAGTEFCLIEDSYKPFIESGGKVASFIYDGYFNDVGTPERYEHAKRDAEQI
jgi:NDP-sugar pyrophosphorylase family protein